MTSSIARMNCFLHGIENFQILRGDTLSEPKFVEGDRLMRFDACLANPPYSIKQWDRDAFASDPWGRNLYGTPPQGRADYAFWQHIIASLARKTGRCAILFPHGVLFRQEEADMRRKLIAADVIECVLGLGPNLFYNSPMEACIVICRATKPKGRKGRILFVNAVNEVTRERAQSFLTGDHIEHIAAAYRDFKEAPGFARVATVEEILQQGGSLNIALYVAANGHPTASNAAINGFSVEESLSAWLRSASEVRNALKSVLGKNIAPSEVTAAATINKTLPPWLKRNEWKRLPFGAFADSVNERVEPANAAEEIYVGLDDIDPGSLHIRRWGKGSDVIGTKLRFRIGDIIFGRRRAYQRKLAVAEMEGICSAHAMVVRANPDLVLPEFLPFLMTSDNFMNRAVEISVGSLSPTINWTTLKNEEFTLPPLDQQRCIAGILWAVDEVQQTYELERSRMFSMRQSWIHHILRTGPVTKLCIRDLGEIITGTTPRTNEPSYYEPPDYLFVSPADINEARYVDETEKRVSELGLESGRPIPCDSVMVVCIGSTIGKVAMASKRCLTNQQINTVICKGEHSPLVVYHLLSSLREEFRKAAGCTAIPILNKGQFSSMRLTVPTPALQKEMSQELSNYERTEHASALLASSAKHLKETIGNAWLWRLSPNPTPSSR